MMRHMTEAMQTNSHHMRPVRLAKPNLNTARLARNLLIRCLSAAAMLIAPVAASWAGSLPSAVSTALARAGIPESSVGVWVQAVDQPRPSLSVNADMPMNPASVMKLVTAFAALERFGPAQTWDTRIATRGEIRNGVLDGDLQIIGSGDPVLNVERLWKLLRQVLALGIREVRGDIVLDATVLRLPPHDPDSFDGRGLRPYNSGPHGLLLHFNTLNLTLLPGAAGGVVDVIPSPPLAGLVIDNRISASPGACGVWYEKLDARLERRERSQALLLLGSLPASCGRRDWSAAPLSPDAFAAALIEGLWAELGGKLGGQVRHATALDGTPLLTDTSMPLADIVREMNKWSSNVIARQLIANLGADDKTSMNAVASGIAVAKAQLESAGIDTTGLMIENGSGLSRIERIRADSLGTLLAVAWQRPFMPEFIAAMPIAGLDGTARRRLADSPARGQAHIKTGTINGVRAFAGYVLDRNNRRHIVVMMVNDPEAAASRAAQDALMEWVWNTP